LDSSAGREYRSLSAIIVNPEALEDPAMLAGVRL
jgi:hypothetical protein